MSASPRGARVPTPDVVGIVLAAGAGRRMGRPKALLRDDAGTPWLHLAVDVLRAGGAGPVLVALGAAADESRDLVPPGATPLVVDDWRAGLGATLRAALAAAGDTDARAALVTLVDLPGLRPEAARRVAAEPSETALRQAVYAGVPGHPVLIGRAHWAALAGALEGDRGARAYVVAHGGADVDCSDLGGGDDVDVP